MPRSPRAKRIRRLALLAAILCSRRRSEACVRERMKWEKEVELLLRESEFERTYRMSLESFDHLLTVVLPALDRSPHSWVHHDPVLPEQKLQLMLDYLAGGMSNDIRRLTGVSHPYFYSILYDTMDAIISLTNLQIKFPMTSSEREKAAEEFAGLTKNRVFNGCVAAMDGWLCKVRAPVVKRDEGAGPRVYFSGHYARMGINVQACCDAMSRFVYLDVSHPGGVNDIRAYRETCLPEVIESMEDKFYIVADNAYKYTDHVLTLFLGSELGDDVDGYKDSFNFHLSQLRIRIEMTFGLFVRKWGVFQRPLQNALKNVTRIIHCSATLHNFVITERLQSTKDPVDNELHAAAAFSHQSFEYMLTYEASDYSNLFPIRNVKRDAIVAELRRTTQLRPGRALT